MNDAARWSELERLYHEALEQPPEERASFVQRACASDEWLRGELESLLVQEEQDHDFLEHPAIQIAAQSMAMNEGEASIEPGTLLGPYKVLEQLAQGGMGIVYRAEQQYPVRRQVALKVIKPGMDSEHVIARFQAERQALALMNHPNIARVLDAGTTSSGRLYFVMELVDGLPVTEYCRKHRLDLRERLTLFIPICQAIEHAHQKGVIHRDIKPSNVLVAAFDGVPVPKVIDFGIAKAMQQPLTERSMHTQVGGPIGTLEYMSPEQAGSFGQDIDTRADVYSLGGLLYELIAGSTPLNRATLGQAGEADILRRIREEDPPAPSTRLGDAKLARTVRGDLDWVVMKALEKDRTRRYASVSALSDDIEAFLTGAPVTAGPVSTRYRLKKMVGRHRRLVGTVAAVAVLLIAGAAFSTREAILARRAQQESAAVSDFLQNGLLAQASASVQANSLGAPDPDLKVRTALDRAAARIGGRFAGQPLVEASIRHTMGATYLDLGLYNEAQRQLERAIELRQRVLGEHDPNTLESQNLLVTVYIAEAKPALAEPLGQKVLAMRRRVLGERHPDTLTSLHNMAAIERAFARDAQAEALYAKVAELRRQVLGAEHPDTLKSLSNLAYVSMLLEKFPQAVEIHSRVLEIRRRVLGEEHPETMQSRYDLAQALLNTDQGGKAEDQLRKVLEWRRRILGPSHRDTLNVLNALGLALMAQGKYTQAEGLFDECLTLAGKTLGEQHPTLAACRTNIGIAYEYGGKYELAVRQFQAIYEVDVRQLGAERPETLRGLTNLAETLGMAGRYAEARPLFERVISLRSRVLGPKNPKTLSSRDALANLDKRQGRFENSEKSFREIVALRREVLGPQHPNTLSSSTSLAEVLLEQAKYREAEPLLREALNATPIDAWTRAKRQSLLGWCLASTNRSAEAEPLLRTGYLALSQEQDRRPAIERAEVERAHKRLLILAEVQAAPGRSIGSEKQ